MRWKAYKTRAGTEQFKPSFELLEELNDEGLGFCLNCADHGTPAEPDARRYTCEMCKQPKVYGAEELALMGLAY